MRQDIGLLMLRVTLGLMMAVAHGWGKTVKVFTGDFTFADPIGIGAAPSLFLAAFAEFVCAVFVVLGIKTRLAALPLTITMLVAAFVVHFDDPWSKKEFALLYLVPFAVLSVTGGGRFALDRLWRVGEIAGKA